MLTLAPQNNTYDTLMVDLTHRCNMHCANCYLPDRHQPDMNVHKLLDCLAQLPKRTNIRLAGGEPTLRPDLPYIISRIKALGHRVVLLTNGLRLAQESYVDSLAQAGLRHVYLSLNGADNDDWYQRLDQLACAEKKMQALHHILKRPMILNTGTILARGINEGAVQRLIQLVKAHQPRHALLRFKNIGALGRYDQQAEQHNLTMAEMEQLLADVMGCSRTDISKYNVIAQHQETNTRLFPLDLSSTTGQGIWIKLTDWQADRDGYIDKGSQRRGRITKDFFIAPFFEDVKANDH